MIPTGGWMTLTQGTPRVPYAEILKQLWALEFDPGASRSQLETFLDADDGLRDLLSPEATVDGGALATKELAFGRYGSSRPWSWAVGTDGTGVLIQADGLTPDDLRAVVHIVRAGANARTRGELRRDLEALGGPSVGERLCALYPEEPMHGTWPVLDRPGVARREHASVVLRSAHSKVVVDPQGLAPGWTTNYSRYPVVAEEFDAVFLTHGHSDHWHLPSTLVATRGAETPVCVPEVPVVNMLSPDDMSHCLQAAAQAVVSARWCSVIEIGDFTVDVLPFYGEQPLRSPPGIDFELRNWGSCYRFSCDDFSALVLADSGIEPNGSVVEAVKQLTDRVGPTDFVLSNCYDFSEGVNPGLPTYAFVLPFERLAKIHRDALDGIRRSITLGVEGIAAVCEASMAKYFLPYAHGFQGLFQVPRSGEGVQEAEAERLARIRSELKARDVGTRVVEWAPGQAVVRDGNEFRLTP